MTRWQILLWLDRYTKRMAYENGAGEKDNPDEQRMTLDKDSSVEAWRSMFSSRDRPAERVPEFP